MPALSSAQKVTCRTINRAFVGLPLCESFHGLHFLRFSLILLSGRDPDWIDLNIQYIFNVVKGGAIIRLFPTFLKP